MAEELNRIGADELRGAQMEAAARLRGAGIDIDDHTDPEALVALLDAVERFEEAVRAHGGDLMLDEPPRGHEGQPDDPRFVLPQRRGEEAVNVYADRIHAATRALLTLKALG